MKLLKKRMKGLIAIFIIVCMLFEVGSLDVLVKAANIMVNEFSTITDTSIEYGESIVALSGGAFLLESNIPNYSVDSLILPTNKTEPVYDDFSDLIGRDVSGIVGTTTSAAEGTPVPSDVSPVDVAYSNVTYDLYGYAATVSAINIAGKYNTFGGTWGHLTQITFESLTPYSYTLNVSSSMDATLGTIQGTLPIAYSDSGVFLPMDERQLTGSAYAGNILKGWRIDYDGDGNIDSSDYNLGDNILYDLVSNRVPNGAVINVFPIYESNQYGVKFDLNGGHCDFQYVPQFADVNTPPTTPDQIQIQSLDGVPEKTGYTFLGWSLNQNATTADYTAGSYFDAPAGTVAGNMFTLYAIWKQNKIVLQFNGSGGYYMQGGEIVTYYDSPQYNYSENIVMPSAATCPFQSEGMHLTGWGCMETGVEYLAGQTINVTTFSSDPWATELEGVYCYSFYAMWDYNKYNLAFHTNGGVGSDFSMVLSNQTIDFSTGTFRDVFPACSFTRSGYRFIGWSVNSTDSGSDVVMPGTAIPIEMISDLQEHDATVDLYAIWEPIPYTVRYNANGGNGEMADQTGVMSGVATILYANQFTNVEYIFAGWATSASGPVEYADQGTISHLASEIGQVIELFAVWKEIEKPPVEEPIEPVPGPTPSDPILVGIGTVHLTAGQAYYLGGDSAYRINGGSTRYPYGTIFYVPSSGNYTISAY